MNVKTEKKRILGKNLVWNKHFLNVLKGNEESDFVSVKAKEFLQEIKEDERIQYCIFSAERGKSQNEFSFHFQGYLEFDRKTDFLAFKNEHSLSDVQIRSGSQSQAIDYVKKQRTKILSEFFEFGLPKRRSTVAGPITNAYCRTELHFSSHTSLPLLSGSCSSFVYLDLDKVGEPLS